MAEYVRECLDYNPETGVLTWKNRPRNHFSSDWKWKGWNTRYSGKPAGTPASNGYLQIVFKPRFLQAHRLAWLISSGKWPAFQIDHINGIKTDNRISNLREATHAENCMNLGLRKSNTSGVKGVFWHKVANKWAAAIGVKGKRLHLGLFEKIEDATDRIRLAREEYHADFANHG